MGKAVAPRLGIRDPATAAADPAMGEGEDELRVDAVSEGEGEDDVMALWSASGEKCCICATGADASTDRRPGSQGPRRGPRGLASRMLHGLVQAAGLGAMERALSKDDDPRLSQTTQCGLTRPRGYSCLSYCRSFRPGGGPAPVPYSPRGRHRAHSRGAAGASSMAICAPAKRWVCVSSLPSKWPGMHRTLLIGVVSRPTR